MIKQLIAAFTDALFPPKCLVCGIFLSRPEKDLTAGVSDDISKDEASQTLPAAMFRNLMTPFICPTCMAGFLPVESPLCSRCGFMFTSREGDDHVCGDCIASPKRFRMARSAGVYEQALLSVLHRFKYGGKIRLAAPLAVMLSAALRKHWDVGSIDMVVPVPLHPKKLKQRGFNQAGLLIKAWQQNNASIPDEVSSLHADQQVLIRTRWTRSQTGLGRKERKKNIKNAFRLNRNACIDGKRVLLVDDVYTTGATVNECAGVLRKGGAEDVDVLTLARAL